MILLIGGEKGGTGKTTIATNLAVLRINAIKDLLLIDTDKQPTASYWCSIREDNEVMPRIASIQKFDKSIRTEIQSLKTKYADIIIDAGGKDSIELRGALLVADIVVFPLRPSQFDLWTLARINQLVDVALEINENLKTYIVLNQTPTNPGAKEAEEAKKLIGDFDNLTLLNTMISERIAFRRSAVSGMGVSEYKPEDIKAIDEMKRLYEEIYSNEK